MFIRDVDLARHEPTLHRDVQWLAQRRLDTPAGVVGTTLTAAQGNFVALNVSPGDVALLDQVAVEVIERVSATQLVVSGLRARDEDAVTPPPGAATRRLVLTGFGPQMALAHAQVLAMLGVAAGTTPQAGVINEASIVNGVELAGAEALLALHLIWSAAEVSSGAGGTGGSGGGAGVGGSARSEHYRRRFDAARARVRALIDTDGDGVADASRALNVQAWVRG